jgi:hypothetical protein
MRLGELLQSECALPVTEIIRQARMGLVAVNGTKCEDLSRKLISGDVVCMGRTRRWNMVLTALAEVRER